MTREFTPLPTELDGFALVKQLFSQEQISQTNKRLATELSFDYKDKNPLFIIVLNGALIFGSDISRLVRVGHAGYDTLAITSYGKGTESSKQPVLTKDIKTPIEGRDVILIEDIVDTGWSISAVKKLLESRNPKSLAICTFLDKPSRREADVQIDYVGQQIDDHFVVGYGLDVNELYRLYPSIWIAKVV